MVTRSQTPITVVEDDTYKSIRLRHASRSTVKAEQTKFYYWFKSQKIHITQGGFSGSLLDGAYESFYSNHQLESAGHFSDGLKEGDWKYWYSNGHLKRIEPHKKGLLHGSVAYFDSSGQFLCDTLFKKGQIHGKYKRIDDHYIITTKFRRGSVVRIDSTFTPSYADSLARKKREMRQKVREAKRNQGNPDEPEQEGNEQNNDAIREE